MNNSPKNPEKLYYEFVDTKIGLYFYSDMANDDNFAFVRHSKSYTDSKVIRCYNLINRKLISAMDFSVCQ